MRKSPSSRISIEGIVPQWSFARVTQAGRPLCASGGMGDPGCIRQRPGSSQIGDWIHVSVSRDELARSLKYLRWLRNFIYQAVPWSEAVACLRAVYITF